MNFDFDNCETIELTHSFTKETDRHCEIRNTLNGICHAQEGIHQMHDCWVIADTFAYNLDLFIEKGHQQNFNMCLAGMRYAAAFAPFLVEEMQNMFARALR